MGTNPKVGILQLVNGELYGGAERVQEMLLQSINRDVFLPYCVALLDGAFVKQARRKGLPVEVILMRSKLDLSVVLKVARYVDCHQIALIHTHTVRTNLVGRLVARIAKIPVVTHVHSLPLYETESVLKNRFNHVVNRLTRRWSDRYICVSDCLRTQLLSEGVPAEQIAVIYNGIELERFRPGANSTQLDAGLSRQQARQELGFDPKAVLIAMVALFRPLKGTEHLIEAMAHLTSEYPEAYCLLVGGFEREGYEKRVRSLSRRLGVADKVFFLGFRKDVAHILTATDVVVLPSLFGEGLPVAILEAMALGNPMVGSRVGGIPELIRDGETGLLVPPGDSLALANAIGQLLEDPEWATGLGKNAQNVVRAQFSAVTMVKATEGIYMGMLD